MSKDLAQRFHLAEKGADAYLPRISDLNVERMDLIACPRAGTYFFNSQWSHSDTSRQAAMTVSSGGSGCEEKASWFRDGMRKAVVTLNLNLSMSICDLITKTMKRRRR